MLSRVSDSLYWMSRYLERAEHTSRLIDLNLNVMLEESPAHRDSQRWPRVLESLRITAELDTSDPYAFARSMTFNLKNKASVVACISAARENARQVRERISTEMWNELNRLYLYVRGANADVLNIQPHDFFQEVKDRVHMFQGITDSTISHNEGWHFIQLGRYLERAGATAALLDAHFTAFPYRSDSVIGSSDYFEWLGLLKSCTAFEAYVKVYTADLRPASIAEYLLLNEDFPHSVRFSADAIQAALNAIADATETRKTTRVHRLAGRLRAELSYDQIDDILRGDLHTYLKDIQKQCDEIHVAIFETYIAYPIEAALRL